MSPKSSPRKYRKLIIAIDGPAGSGKSTTAKYLAQLMGLPYIDTGAMYRAVTLAAMKKNIPFEKVSTIALMARKARIRFGRTAKGAQIVYWNGKDISKAIREPELTKNVMFVAREGRIRREMVKKQRAMGKTHGAVMEGRDIGSVVFPNADFKFYFDADVDTRALRRWRELEKAGKGMTLAQVKKEVIARDLSDFKRKEGALKVAQGAMVLDTSGLTIPQTAVKILKIIGKGSQ